MNSSGETSEERLLRSMFGAPTVVNRGPATRGPSLAIFGRMHDAFANAERQLLRAGQDTERPRLPVIPGNTGDDLMHGLLPQTQAPIDFTCTICMETINKGTPQQILNCGHKFCAACFSSWQQTRGNGTTCPMCRTPVTMGLMAAPTTIAGPALPAFRGTSTMTPQQQSMAVLLRNFDGISYH